jgi:hypothetical protein
MLRSVYDGITSGMSYLISPTIFEYEHPPRRKPGQIICRCIPYSYSPWIKHPNVTCNVRTTFSTRLCLKCLDKLIVEIRALYVSHNGEKNKDKKWIHQESEIVIETCKFIVEREMNLPLLEKDLHQQLKTCNHPIFFIDVDAMTQSINIRIMNDETPNHSKSKTYKLFNGTEHLPLTYITHDPKPYKVRSDSHCKVE